MTKQEIFDKVKAHLLAQNARSVQPVVEDGMVVESCAYRGENGLKCAVGCLIADEHYSSVLEGKSAVALVVNSALLDSGVPTLGLEPMLRGLQRIHDHETPDDWPHFLQNLAVKHGLTP